MNRQALRWDVQNKLKEKQREFPPPPNFLDHWVTSQSEGKALVSETSIKSLFLKEHKFFFVQITHDEWKGENKNPQIELFNPFLSDAMIKVLPKSHQ